MDLKNNKASLIAKGGLLTALGVLSLYLSSYLPTNRLFMESIATCIIIISILVSGLKNGMLVYASTAVLALLICGVRLTTIAYILFFGTYGFIKYYIEKLDKILLEYLVKILFFNLCLLILFLIYKLFLPTLLDMNKSIYLIIAAAQIFFLVYDYVLTLFISYFKRRYSKFI